MINAEFFLETLEKNNIDFFTGVPDSLLKSLCLCIDNKYDDKSHIIAANEGSAIAIAAGYHLGSGKLPLVYMQNSGLGNAVNPLASLCDAEVYSIPMLLLIGWRGKPGAKDEPQHVKQGGIQKPFLKALDIPFQILCSEDDESSTKEKIELSINLSIKQMKPHALIVEKNTFIKYKSEYTVSNDLTLTRERLLEMILDNLNSDDIIISTTGKTSRELFELIKKGNYKNPFFPVVGSMGHCSAIGQGIALTNSDKKIICIDGDGSLIMHMGSSSLAGQLNLSNFYHILINNFVHESVGGQETASKFIEYSNVAKGLGYQNIFSASNENSFNSNIKENLSKKGPNFFQIKTKPGSRDNLGRPDKTPLENKVDFIKSLNN